MVDETSIGVENTHRCVYEVFSHRSDDNLRLKLYFKRSNIVKVGQFTLQDSISEHTEGEELYVSECLLDVSIFENNIKMISGCPDIISDLELKKNRGILRELGELILTEDTGEIFILEDDTILLNSDS